MSRLKAEDPEAHKALTSRGGKSTRKISRPHGMTLRQWAASIDDAQKIAKKIMKNIEGDLPENVIAREAMKEAITLLGSEGVSVKDKMSVIRTLLEYNMAKPAATSNVNLKTAEDFLDEIADDT